MHTRGVSTCVATALTCGLLAGGAHACLAPSDSPPVTVQFIGTPADQCLGDFDFNGDVGFSDLLQVITGWGPCEGFCPQDINMSGAVDFADLIFILISWGPCIQVECVLLTVEDYTTFAADPETFCAVALLPLGPIVSVASVEVIHADSGEPIEGLGFIFADTVGEEFDVAGGARGFVGFLAEAVGGIPPGLPVDIQFKVSVPKGTTFQDILEALSMVEGGSGIIASDGANADGTLTGEFLSIITPATVTQVSCPGDMDLDGDVDDADIKLMTALVGSSCPGGQPGCLGDLDDDGQITIEDLTALLAVFGPCPGVLPSGPPPCLADLDGDGEITSTDLIQLLTVFGPCPDGLPGCPGDLDLDGDVGDSDVALITALIGTSCPR